MLFRQREQRTENIDGRTYNILGDTDNHKMAKGVRGLGRTNFEERRIEDRSLLPVDLEAHMTFLIILISLPTRSQAGTLHLLKTDIFRLCTLPNLITCAYN